MNKQSYVRVDLGSRNEVEDLQLVVLDQPLISYLNSMYDELAEEVEDQEYFDEFACNKKNNKMNRS